MNMPARSDQPNIISITVAPDKMKAFLSVETPGGQGINTAEVFKELEKQGIMYGVDLDRIQALCQSSLSFNHELIAEGTPSIPGEDAEIEYYFHPTNLIPELTEDGRVDYYNLGIVTQVQAGDVLAVRKPATPGTEGYNVRGEVLKPMPGKQLHFQTGKGIVIENDRALAEFEGAIHWQGNRIGVSRMKVIDGDVDFSTGNIDFPGKLVITGWIRSGFRAEADEDIEVRGGIEDAWVLSRQGSVFVHQGIAGRNNAVIKAKANVEAKYIQEAEVSAEKNVVVNEYIIRARIQVGNALLLQGRKGRLMGQNQISAGTQIKINTIQSNKDLNLVVSGIDRNAVFTELKALNQQLEKEEALVRMLTLKLRMLAGKKDADSIKTLKTLLPQYTQAAEQMELKKARRDENMILLRSVKGDGMIEVREKVDYGTSFQIKNEYIKVDHDLKNITLFYDNEEKKIVVLNN